MESTCESCIILQKQVTELQSRIDKLHVTELVSSLEYCKQENAELSAKVAGMAKILEYFRAGNFGDLLKLWNYESLGHPDLGLIPINSIVKISVSVKAIREAEEALSTLPEQSQKLLAVVEAADAWERGEAEDLSMQTRYFNLVKAVHALRGDKLGNYIHDSLRY